MAKKSQGKIPPIEDQIKFAQAFGDMILFEIDQIMDSADKKDRPTAMFSVVKVLTIIWVNLMRESRMSPIQAFGLMSEIWKTVEEADEEMEKAGGLH